MILSEIYMYLFKLIYDWVNIKKLNYLIKIVFINNYQSRLMKVDIPCNWNQTYDILFLWHGKGRHHDTQQPVYTITNMYLEITDSKGRQFLNWFSTNSPGNIIRFEMSKFSVPVYQLSNGHLIQAFLFQTLMH